MSVKLVLFSVDDGYLMQKELYFEAELGWLYESGIKEKQIYHIPDELSHLEPIETLWLMNQITQSLEALKNDGKINDFTDEMVCEIVKAMHNNHESIDQDVHWVVEKHLINKGIIKD
jgi:DNA-binding MltR family transcriptional regulator